MEASLKERLEKLIKQSKIVLFMKGDRFMPQCGFSAHAIEILEGLGADFSTFDILEDEEVRQGLKEYSEWPTYPQLYINGELIGGMDIMQEMYEEGELEPLLTGK